MLRPAYLEVQAFRGWREAGTVRLDRDVTLLLAGNGYGKSSTLNALEWCLYGNETAKKSSGIVERADWETRNREAVTGAMRVRLVLRGKDGEVRIHRGRPESARPRDPDIFEVLLPGGELLEYDDAEDWMATSGMPDWRTWRYAFCQHQEAARARLVEKADRSMLLASLLGLDEYHQLQKRLNDLKPKSFLKELNAEIAGIEQGLHRAVERPTSDLEEIERRLEVEQGIPRAEVGEHRAEGVARDLVARGARVAEALRLDDPLPGEGSGGSSDATLRWARDWGHKARTGVEQRRRQLVELRESTRRLAGTLEDLEPSHARLQAAVGRVEDLEREHGSVEALAAQAETIERDLGQLAAAIVREQERFACLSQARDLLRAADHPDRCPVCETASPDLVSRLDEFLRENDSAEARELKTKRDHLEQRRTTLLAQRRLLETATDETRDRKRAFKKREAELHALLPEAFSPATGDARTEGTARLRDLHQSIEKVETALQATESDLAAHDRDADVLGLLVKWLAARNRARVSGNDLTRHPAWNDLQSALDEASGLAVDMLALGVMARGAQERRSSERVEEVNRCLGDYLSLITGNRDHGRVGVRVHRTATRLTYDLVDGEGRNVLPVLNQAALNSLSLATLFAEAEDRTRRGLPAWLVLDDPTQSLDQQHVEGLARAIERVAEHCPVILGTVPGRLAERLQEMTTRSLRVVQLAPWDPRSGIRVVEESPA